MQFFPFLSPPAFQFLRFPLLSSMCPFRSLHSLPPNIFSLSFFFPLHFLPFIPSPCQTSLRCYFFFSPFFHFRSFSSCFSPPLNYSASASSSSSSIYIHIHPCIHTYTHLWVMMGVKREKNRHGCVHRYIFIHTYIIYIHTYILAYITEWNVGL